MNTGTKAIHCRAQQQELHSTVKQQWPTLKRQYNTTIDLTDRLKAISGEVKSLESELDGDVSSISAFASAAEPDHTADLGLPRRSGFSTPTTVTSEFCSAYTALKASEGLERSS